MNIDNQEKPFHMLFGFHAPAENVKKPVLKSYGLYHHRRHRVKSGAVPLLSLHDGDEVQYYVQKVQRMHKAKWTI